MAPDYTIRLTRSRGQVMNVSYLGVTFRLRDARLKSPLTPLSQRGEPSPRPSSPKGSTKLLNSINLPYVRPQISRRARGLLFEVLGVSETTESRWLRTDAAFVLVKAAGATYHQCIHRGVAQRQRAWFGTPRSTLPHKRFDPLEVSSGCSAAAARLVWDQEVAGSIPATPTRYDLDRTAKLAGDPQMAV